MLRLAALFTALLLAPLATAAAKWHTLQAPHCMIVSQLPERDTRAWASQFEQFTSALRGVLTIDERYLPPLTVVLFAGSRDFDPYCPRTSNGKKREIAGFFGNRQTWGVIGLADSFSDESTRHIVLHEATHWLISATPTRLPLWLNEGFAEVFSSFESKKGFGLLGKPIDSHVAALKREQWVPLFQLLLANEDSRLYSDNDRKTIYYAQSWLFAHRLLFLDPKSGYAALNRFFDAQLHGASQTAAFEAAFGKDVPAMESELEKYFRRGGFVLTKLPLPAEAKVDAPFLPAPEPVVAAALARLSLSSDLTDLARTHIERALALAPDTPTPHELNALLHYQLNDLPTALTSARRAIELGSRDAWMHLIAARELWRVQADRGTLDTAAREIANHYAQAIALQPKLRHAYSNLAQIVSFVPEATADDAKLLVAGFKLFPDASELLIGLGAIQHKAGNDTEAQRMLELALAHPENLDQNQRNEAERLRAQWKIEPLARQIEAHVKQRQFPEALAVCDTILKESLQIRQRHFWEGRRQDLGFQHRLHLAQTAASSGDLEAAITLVEELLAQPELTQLQRNHTRRYLENLRRRVPDSTEE